MVFKIGCRTLLDFLMLSLSSKPLQMRHFAKIVSATFRKI